MPYIGQARRGLPSAQVSEMLSPSLILPSRPLPARTQAFESIATATGTGSSSTITLNSGGAWANYRHLYVIANLSHNSSGWDDIILRANGVTSGYSTLRHFNYVSGSTFNYQNSGSASATHFGAGKIAESSASNITSLEMWFFEHNNANTVVTCLLRDNATVNSNASTDYQSGVYGSCLPGVTQLTSLTLSTAGGGNISTASEVMVFGIKE